MPPTIEQSKMTIKSVIAICSTIVTVGGLIAGASWRISSAVTDINNQIRGLASAIEDVRTHSYTLDHASEQALRTAIENPSLRVPDPRDPTRLIVVRSGGGS